jgi:type II secretory pathway pseudopilin PulG
MIGAGTPIRRPHRAAGLTLVELLISVAITAIVGAALATLLHAVARATETGVQTREVVIRAHAIDSRVSLYTDSALALLDVRDGGDGFALWLGDTRESGTVHATEIRWLVYDAETRQLSVHYVEFPEGWTQELQDLWDQEYAAAGYADGDAWWTVLTDYEALGYTASTLLGDELSGVSATIAADDEYDAEHVRITYLFGEAGTEDEVLTVAGFEDYMHPG